jgi:phosphatidate cytidylyltransferase
MLITRLWTGALLILIGAGILLLDQWLDPWYPILLLSACGALLLATRETLGLLPAPGANPILAYAGVMAVLLANWPGHVWQVGDSWHGVGLVAILVLLLTFLFEAARFVQPGEATLRIASTWFVVGYLGVLVSFLIQLRWHPAGQGALALALAIFVPKSCDIGAYFTGRAIGKHRMSPVLSPKKTWEGAVGGLIVSVAVAMGINALGTHTEGGRPLLGWLSAAAFGLVVGVVGLLGDLMESLLKRDSGKKDAAHFIPSFGGVLDVLDSILFSAPVSYVWIRSSTAW